VVGVDYCGRFVNTAMQIQNEGVVKFGNGKEAKIPDGIKAKNVNFVQVGCHNVFYTVCTCNVHSVNLVAK